MTGVAAARRYALLNALLWLPAGLYLVPLVLLMLDRGLPVSTIAVVGVVYGLTAAVLELPTGGLADVLGRRPVLIASAVAGAAGLLLLGLADTVALFVASAVLRGTARALSTGPLEAWYVDTVHAESGRDADLTPGLARGEVAASLALGAGTLVGGLLPLVLGDRRTAAGPGGAGADGGRRGGAACAGRPSGCPSRRIPARRWGSCCAAYRPRSSPGCGWPAATGP